MNVRLKTEFTGQVVRIKRDVFSSAFLVIPLKKPNARNTPLNTPDQQTFYADGPQGYTDYPPFSLPSSGRFSFLNFNRILGFVSFVSAG